jgi:hypothetical protein
MFRDPFTNQGLNCRVQVKSLIEPFKSINVLVEWPKNRLLGKVICQFTRYASFSTGALSPNALIKPKLEFWVVDGLSHCMNAAAVVSEKEKNVLDSNTYWR